MKKNNNMNWKNVIIFFVGLSIILALLSLLKKEEHDKEKIKKEIEGFHQTKDSTIKVVDEFVNSYQKRKEQQIHDIDSLNHILENNKKLSKQQIVELKNKIEEKQNTIVEISKTKELDTVLIEFVKEKKIIYDTIFEKVIIRDTVYITDTIHKLDTVYVSKKEKRKNKKKKN